MIEIKSLAGDLLWRTEKTAIGRTDLYGVELNLADLRGRDLMGLDFGGAALNGASLSRANLRNANLSQAYLYKTDFAGADIRATHFGYEMPHRAKQFMMRLTGSRGTLDVIGAKVRIGCQYWRIGRWLRDYRKIGLANDYSQAEIVEYG